MWHPICQHLTLRSVAENSATNQTCLGDVSTYLSGADSGSSASISTCTASSLNLCTMLREIRRCTGRSKSNQRNMLCLYTQPFAHKSEPVALRTIQRCNDEVDENIPIVGPRQKPGQCNSACRSWRCQLHYTGSQTLPLPSTELCGKLPRRNSMPPHHALLDNRANASA